MYYKCLASLNCIPDFILLTEYYLGNTHTLSFVNTKK